MGAFSIRIRGRRSTADERAEENRLSAEQCRRRDTVLATVPTTPAGLASLVQFLRDEIAASGMADGGPPDDDHPVWRDGLRALLAAQEAELRADNGVVHPDAALLALAPTLLPMLDEYDRTWAIASDLHEPAVKALGGEPDFAVVGRAVADAWDKRLHASEGWSKYMAAREPADILDGRIEAMVADHMEVPARTLDGLLLKQRIGRSLEQYQAYATNDLGRLLDDASGLAGISGGFAVAAAGAVVNPRPAFVEAHPDAKLLAQGPAVARIAERRDSLYPATRDTELAALRAVGRSPEAHTPECRDWFMRLRDEQARNGHDAANDAYNAADNELLATLIDLAEIRATTMDGLIFKARLAHAHEVEEIANGIVADLIAMEEVDEGRQIESSLSDQIIACWREWATLTDFNDTEQGEANYERLNTERSALCAAAEALPVTLGNVPTKALALAWLEYCDLWRHGQAHEDYGLDGRLALDIDTAICGRLKTQYSGEAA